MQALKGYHKNTKCPASIIVIHRGIPNRL